MRSRYVQSWCSSRTSTAAVFAAFGACALLSFAVAFGDEPGQTPRPKDTPPPADIPEEELVKLDKKFPHFEFVEDDAPFINRGHKIADARRANAADREQKAYDYVLEFAARQPTERMRKYSIKSVPVENLYRSIRQDYLRELLHFEGKVALVHEMKPTDELAELAGIKQLYEVWIWPKDSTKLFCVVVSEIPEGLKLGEDHNQFVAFDAYLFKLWHYESRRKKEGDDSDKRQWERAPLFLGKTVELIADPTPPQDTFSPVMLGAVIGGLATICVVAFLITLWFRKGDRHVRYQARQKIESQVSFENIPDLGGPVDRIQDRSFPQ